MDLREQALHWFTQRRLAVGRLSSKWLPLVTASCPQALQIARFRYRWNGLKYRVSVGAGIGAYINQSVPTVNKKTTIRYSKISTIISRAYDSYHCVDEGVDGGGGGPHVAC